MNSHVLEVTPEMRDEVNAINDAARKQQAFHNQVFTNVHSINAIFDKSEDSLTNWKNKEINLDNTLGFWAAGVTYNKYDIVYFSFIHD